MSHFKIHKQPTKRTSNGKDAVVYEYQNFRGTLLEIMAKFPMNKTESAIRWRLRRGDDIKKAIEEPAYTYQRQHGDAGCRRMAMIRHHGKEAATEAPASAGNS